MSSFPAPRHGVIQLSLLLVLATAARAGYVHQRWTVREGLPVNSVTDVLQSRQGYLWLTTFDGLVRFDGVRFVTFTDADTPGLGSNRLTSLVETSDGKLLLTSEAGDLSLFDPGALRARTLAPPGTNQRLMVARPDGEIYVAMRPGLARLRGDRLEPVASTQLGSLDIVAIAFDEGGGIWLGCRGRGLRHLRADGTVEAVTTADGLSSDMVLSLFVAPEGVVWAGSDRGVDVVRGRQVHAVLAAGRLWSAYVHQIVRHPDGSLVFVTEAGLFRYSSGEVTRFDSEDRLRAPLHPVRKAADGAVWVATATAVVRDGVAVFRLPEPERARIRTMTFDDDGNVWIAASGGGLHQLRRALFEGIGVEEGLSAREVYPLEEDATGAIWIGTQKGGLNRYAHGAMRAYGLEDGLLDDNIKAILEDRAGTLWIGTYEAGLFRREGDRFVAERIPGVSSASLRVFALFEDRAGALWAGTSAGLLRRWRGQWTRIDSSASGELPLAAIVRVIRETADGALWIGTHGNGAARRSGGAFTWFTTANGLASNRVRDLYAADNGVLWVATEDRGLSRIAWGGGTRSIVSVGSAQGVPAAGVHQIVPDGHGWLWMSTNHGVFRVEERILEDVATGRRTKLDVVLWGERDGMRNREANGGVQSAALRARDGKLWFATIDGVAIADPDPRRLAPPPVRVALEGVTANGREHRLRDALELAAEDRSFRVDYTGFSLAAPERIRFRHRLDGFDAGWIEAGNRRSAFFTNVPPGRYRFRLQASTGGAGAPAWSEQEAVLPLTVRPWFYETLWFRVLLGIAALTALTIAHRLRTRWLEHQRRELTRQVKLRTQTIEEQAGQLRELDRQKSRFFADLSHELRTPLTLIIGPLEDARRELEAARAAESTRPAVEGAIRNAHALLELTNQLLDLAKLQSGKFELDRRDDDLVALLVGIAERFAPLARQRGIAFAHALPAAPVIAGFDRRQLSRVIDNLLSNAFKFTPRGGSVRLTLAVSENHACIGVADTGPGIAAVHLPRIFDRFYQADDPSGRLQPGTGIGLAMVHELTTLHGGSLEVASTIGVGTSFTVVLPLVAATPASNETSVRELAPAEPAERELMTIDADRATILIVDDEAEIRAYLRRHLEPRYRVLEAGEGEAALAIVSGALPDLVVADVMMPRLDGFDLCRAIKADREIDFIPIILLTARAGTDDRLEGLGSLADDYVTKPFDARELLARADNLIASRRKLRERFASAATEAASDPVAELVPSRPSDDELYRQRLIAAIDRHLSDETFRVADLSRLMAQDRTQLFRRTRDLTGEAPSDLIRNRRLARAAELLRAREGQVGEVAYAVGFNSVSYFIKCFRESYGVTPARFAETSNAG